MAKAREQPNDREVALRARRQARLLDARVFASCDGIYLVSGKPEFGALLKGLEALESAPRPGREPGPLALGFTTGQARLVTEELLADLGRALQKWRKVTRDKDARKKRKAADARELRQWKQEVAALGRNLHRLHALLRLHRDGCAPETAYVPPTADRSADALTDAVLRGRHVPDAWRWLGRLVLWLGGERACERFAVAVAPLSLTETDRLQADAARRVETVARCWSRRLSAGKCDDGAVPLDGSSIKAAIEEELFVRNGRAAQLLNIGPPGRPRDIGAYLDSVVARCELLLKPTQALPSLRRVAAVAALCALDGSSEPLPPSLLTAPYGDNAVSQRIHDLARLAAEDGYAPLLRMLADAEVLCFPDASVEELRDLALTGADADDVVWLIRLREGWPYVAAFAQAGISPRSIRLLVKETSARGGTCADEEIVHALDRAAQNGNTRIADALYLWLTSMSAARLNANTARRFWHMYLEALSLAGLGQSFDQMIRRWVAPRPRKHPFSDAGVTFPKTLARRLDLLAHYQRLAGEEPRLTRSLQTLLRQEERRAQEMDHLARQESLGVLGEGAAKRLRLLRSRHRAAAVAPGKAARQIDEVCAVTAVEGLRRMLVSTTERLWLRFARRDPDRALSRSQKLEILRWARLLPSKAALRLEELLAAWAAHGHAYRQYLPANTQWFERSRPAPGIDLTQWLYPEQKQVVLGEQQVTIEVARDPFRAFLMGSYFETCLGLREGCNRDSVLANAYEANKAVLYAVSAGGDVVGRKLVGVTPAGQLVGFRTYTSVADETESGRLRAALHAYCGEWAARCNARLGDFSAPEALAGLFWYDDGLEPWTPEAFAAWQGACGSLGRCSTLPGLLSAHWETCRAILAGPGLTIESACGSPDALAREAPGLGEELLAEVAIEQNDRDLLSELEETCTTAGGRIQAVKASVALDPDSVAAAVHRGNCLRGQPWEQKLAGILREAGTPAAVRELAAMCLSKCCRGAMDLLFAAAGSASAASEICRWLMRESRWYLQSNMLQALLQVAARQRNRHPRQPCLPSAASSEQHL